MSEFVIELHTLESLGDRSTERVYALEVVAGETVEDLVRRVAPMSDRRYRDPAAPRPDRLHRADFIVIRSIATEER